MIGINLICRARRTLAFFLVGLSCVAFAQAATTFNGVAAGDMTETGAIIWTRTTADATLRADIALDSAFTNIVSSQNGVTTSAGDHTMKLTLAGLQSNTVYYYRFVSSDSTTSATGTFKTAPTAAQNAPVRFGFSGDADGQWRPYSSIADIASANLDFFVFLGDTIYETASLGSPVVADPVANPVQALADFRRKYLENISPVNPGGQADLEPMFTPFGHYTLLDNHELGNKQLQTGGAPQGTPPGAGVDAANVANDVNTTGSFLNQTLPYLTLLQAYTEYQPIRTPSVSAPGDSRSNGTQQQYFAQPWGAHLLFINLDDRSYRDIRLRTASGADDTGPRADNPNRTMLGAPQLAWFEQTLLTAQQNGVTWKVIAISSPIDILGGDGGKSWIGGYRSERNQILKFIADNQISHVVFLTTDDHQYRINELTYVPDPAQPTTYVRVPGCFQLLAGPVGAGGPDAITDHSFANILSLTKQLVASQVSQGIDPIGLDPSFPGLHNVSREGDPDADTLRQPFDFYSPDTFNYATLALTPDGATLSVDLFGINSYAANTFPEKAVTGAVRHILGFQVDAFSLVNSRLAVRGTGFVYSRASQLFTTTITVTNTSGQPITGPIQAVFAGLPGGVSLANITSTFAGSPYVAIPGGGLSPGQSVSFPVQFRNLSSADITYTLNLYSGAF